MKWYELTNPNSLDTPALMVHPDRVVSNINRAKEIVGDVNRLRPHVKTHKMLEVGKIQVEQGIKKFKCATLAEAEMMARAGAENILIAYQLVGPRPAQLSELKLKYPSTTFSSLVDSISGVDRLVNAAQDEQRMSVYIDLNLGHHRSGIQPGRSLSELIDYIRNQKNVELIGFHGYDGHIRDEDVDRRINQSDSAFEALQPFLKKHPDLLLVAGGSPTFAVHSRYDNRESSPGTFVFWDHGYQSKFPQYQFLYAAVLGTRVISKLDNRTFCFDLGHKHVAAEGTHPQITFFDTPNYQQQIHSEEHLTVKFEEDMQLEVGDILYGVPRHICPTVALYPAAQVVRDHEIDTEWEVTARNISL